MIFGIQLKEQIQLNYGRIKQDVKEIVSNEMERIKNDSKLKHLVKEDSSIQNLKESEHSAEGDRFRNIKR